MAGPSGPAFLYNFYPRSPCGERPRDERHANNQQEFLSTLSLRRATIPRGGHINQTRYFYPRSPCGERRYLGTRKSRYVRDFYPRSPCGERLMDTLILANAVLFLSTLSLRRATYWPGVFVVGRYFYPRSPCGERRVPEANNRQGQQISIHALLAESDSPHSEPNSGRIRFLSTLSLRRAT